MGKNKFKMSSPYKMGSHDLSKKHGTNANYARTGGVDSPTPIWKGLKKMGGKFLRGEGAFGLLNPAGAVINSVLGKKNPVANVGVDKPIAAATNQAGGGVTPTATTTPTANNVIDQNAPMGSEGTVTPDQEQLGTN